MNRKVLFIVNSMENGGAERVCANLANAYSESGDDVDIITIKEYDGKKAYKLENGINIYSLGYKLDSKISKISCCLLGCHRLSRVVKRLEKTGRYDLITSHLPTANLVTRFSRVGRKAIYVFHSTMTTFYSGKGLLFRLILKWFFYKRKIACVSNGIKDECVEIYHLNRNYIRTIYNPIIIGEINNKANILSEEIQKCKPYMLVVGRLSREKRQDRAIEIFNKGRFFEKFNLVICGVGDLEDDLRRQAIEIEKPESIHFVGWQSNPYNWMKNSELVLCTSEKEGFPMNLVEAFSCGAKVVSSDCNFGPKEILKGDFSKFLAKEDDVDAYINKINMALKNYPRIKNPIIHECESNNVIEHYISFYKENM